jgi:hypothetical protein
MAKDPKYNETVHSITGESWMRNCETLCDKQDHKCELFAVGNSSKLATRGKIITQRLNALFKSTPGADTFSDHRTQLGTTSEIIDQIGYGVQAHHMLSSSRVLSDEFKKFAEAAAYDVNNGWNCIFLPADFGHQKWDDLQKHYGKHEGTDYIEEIDKVIKKLLAAKNKSSVRFQKNVQALNKLYLRIEGAGQSYFKEIDDRLKDITKGYEPIENSSCDKEKMKELHAKFHEAEDKLFEDFKNKNIWLYPYSRSALELSDFRSEPSDSSINNTCNTKEGFFNWIGTGIRKEKIWYKNQQPPYCDAYLQFELGF